MSDCRIISGYRNVTPQNSLKGGPCQHSRKTSVSMVLSLCVVEM